MIQIPCASEVRCLFDNRQRTIVLQRLYLNTGLCEELRNRKSARRAQSNTYHRCTDRPKGDTQSENTHDRPSTLIPRDLAATAYHFGLANVQLTHLDSPSFTCQPQAV
jgi:hypothetical protein